MTEVEFLAVCLFGGLAVVAIAIGKVAQSLQNFTFALENFRIGGIFVHSRIKGKEEGC